MYAVETTPSQRQSEFGRVLVDVDGSEESREAAVTAAADADLLVVGSRGLPGFQELSSVADRVAHRARSSVLIVREPVRARRGEEPARAA